jgi:hypothetical protein
VSLWHSCCEGESSARQGKAAAWLLRGCDLSSEISRLWSSTCYVVGRREVPGLRATTRYGTGHGRDPFGKVRLAHWRGRFFGETSSQ